MPTRRSAQRPKESDRSQSITMNYSLERQGDEWRIKNRSMQQMHEQQAPGQPALPPGHPTPGGPGETARQLPPASAQSIAAGSHEVRFRGGPAGGIRGRTLVFRGRRDGPVR